MNEYRGHPVASWVCMLIAFVLFLLAAMTAGGMISSHDDWFVDGGLAAMALAFLIGW
jgi:hypothetical protein